MYLGISEVIVKYKNVLLLCCSVKLIGSLGDTALTSIKPFSNSYRGEIVFLVKLPSGECHKILLIIS